MRLPLLVVSLLVFTVNVPAQDLRVMSYNIRYATAPDGVNAWANRKEFLAETIRKFNPDLLGTQETLLVQLRYLEDKFPEYASFAAGRDDGKEKGEMAALFYRKDRFEKLDGGHFWLSKTPDKVGSKGIDAALPRIATWVKLKDKNNPAAKPILYLNTHFDHRGELARREGASLIRDRLEAWRKECRLVVTGDFNAGEQSMPYHDLFVTDKRGDSPVMDTYRSKHPEAGKNEGTFSAFQASKTTGDRIDWIACSRDFILKEASIDRTAKDGRTPSDHFAVTAVLSSK